MCSCGGKPTYDPAHAFCAREMTREDFARAFDVIYQAPLKPETYVVSNALHERLTMPCARHAAPLQIECEHCMAEERERYRRRSASFRFALWKQGVEPAS